METKLSFILPIYNVEKYLPQCIDSILCQITGECEIILVDDGATDGSGAICDRYQEAYPEIRVIHQANGGLSAARNAGMEIASGRYVCFVDSDDWIAENTVEKLLEWIDENNCDVCFLELTKVYPNGREQAMAEGLETLEIRGKNREQVLEFLARCPKFPGSACGKLLKRAFLLEHGIRFPGDRRLSEDLCYCLKAYLEADSFDYLDFPFYMYRQDRSGSITNEVNARYYFDTGLFVEEVCRRFSDDSTVEGTLALSYGAYEYGIVLWQVLLRPEADREKAWEWLRKYRRVLGFGKSNKTKMIYMASRLVGLKNTAKLLDLYQRR